MFNVTYGNVAYGNVTYGNCKAMTKAKTIEKIDILVCFNSVAWFTLPCSVFVSLVLNQLNIHE